MLPILLDGPDLHFLLLTANFKFFEALAVVVLLVSLFLGRSDVGIIDKILATSFPRIV